jgi:hypothetical protein
MGNSADCCSDGVLVPNNNAFPSMTGPPVITPAMLNTLMSSSSMNNVGFGGAGSVYTPSSTLLVKSDIPMPSIPPILPPSTVMDAMSAKALQSVIMDDGPYPKDG